MSFSRTKVPGDAVLYAIVAGLIFFYLLLRAVLVPLVHDEANTFFHFVHNGTWVPFLAHWDAGNHVLAMAAGNVTTALFGSSAFALRSFALLCFLLYAWYVWRIGSVITDRLVRWCTWLALLGTPFVLEFFALFRGYGPSLALLMMGIYHLAATWRTGGIRDALLAPLALGLAVVANLSLLPMWAAGMGLLSVLAMTSAQGRIIRVAGLILGVVPGLIMIAFALGLRDRGLLYHGNMQGVLNGSTASLVEVMLGTELFFIRLLVAVLFVAIIYATYRMLQSTNRSMGASLLVVSVGSLIVELGSRMLLGGVLEVLYPTYRAAMHWVPPFVLAFGLAVDQASVKAHHARWAALLLAVLPLRSAYVSNTRSVTNWTGEYLPAFIYRTVMEQQRSAGFNLSISIPPTLAPIWDHYNLTQGYTAVLPDVREVPDTLADLLIAPSSTVPPIGYRSVMQAGSNDLLERIEQLTWAPFAGATLQTPLEDPEFRTLLDNSVQGQLGLPVRLSVIGAVSGPKEDRGELFLVTELRNASGEFIHYRALPLHRSLQPGRADLINMVQVLPALPAEADRLVLYIWAPDRRRYALDGLVATFMEPLERNTTNH